MMKLVKTNLNGAEFWYRSDDKFIGQRIALGKYEEYEAQLLLSQVNSESIAVDVGANIGYYTILLAQVCKKVYAIEPETKNFEILIKNIRANNLKNVVAIKAAVSDKKGTKKLKIDPENYGNHQLNGQKGQIINCLRLEEILKNEQKISLIKSDTQGWEPAVIKSALKIIKSDSPTLFIEYWPEGAEEQKQDLRSMMQELRKIYGKNIWQIDEELFIYKRAIDKIRVNPKTGYADLWMKKNPDLKDYFIQYSQLRLKKLIKRWLG